MNKFLFFLLMIFSYTTQAHEVGVKKYIEGVYKSNPFEYPASLTNKKIEIIVNEIGEISDYEILYVKQNDKHYYEVSTCSKGERHPNKCDAKEVYYFGEGKIEFVNLSINPSTINYIRGEKDIVLIEYSKGRYENFPFKYPADITEDEIEEIIEIVLKNTEYEILNVLKSFNNELTYKIMTCSAGSRVVFCDAGESFEYNIKSKKIINESRWIQ